MKTGYVSTSAIALALRGATMRRQSEMVTAQKEAQSGVSADVNLRLGARAGTAVSLDRDIGRLDGLVESNGLLSSRLSATQNALGQIASSGQSFIKTLSTALGGALDPAVLRATAFGALDATTSALNTSFNGEYIFAGANTDVRPIEPYGDGSAGKAAIDAAFQSYFGFAPTDPATASIGGTAMSDFITNALPAVFSPAGWSSSFSSASDSPIASRIALNETADTSVSANRGPARAMVMATAMAANLLGLPLSEGARQALVKGALDAATSATAGITALQADTGVIENRVRSATDRLTAQRDLFATHLAGLGSVDPYEAALRVAALKTQIESSYALTASLRQLSLTKYL